MPLDAIVLAAAGLKRLGLEDSITEMLDTEIMLPAAGQGFLGIEARASDEEILEVARSLENDTARIEAMSERHLLDLLDGGCRAPVGILACASDGVIELNAAVVSLDGRRVVRAKSDGDSKDWREAAWKVAQELKAGGAAEIIENARREGG